MDICPKNQIRQQQRFASTYALGLLLWLEKMYLMQWFHFVRNFVNQDIDFCNIPSVHLSVHFQYGDILVLSRQGRYASQYLQGASPIVFSIRSMEFEFPFRILFFF